MDLDVMLTNTLAFLVMFGRHPSTCISDIIPVLGWRVVARKSRLRARVIII